MLQKIFLVIVIVTTATSAAVIKPQMPPLIPSVSTVPVRKGYGRVSAPKRPVRAKSATDSYTGWSSDDLPSTDPNDIIPTDIFNLKVPFFKTGFEENHSKISGYSYALNLVNEKIVGKYENFPGGLSLLDYPNLEYYKFDLVDKVKYGKDLLSACEAVNGLLQLDLVFNSPYKSMKPEEFLSTKRHMFAVIIEHRWWMSDDPSIQGYKIRFVRLNYGGIWSFKDEYEAPFSFLHNKTIETSKLGSYMESQIPGRNVFCGMYQPGYQTAEIIELINSGKQKSRVYCVSVLYTKPAISNKPLSIAKPVVHITPLRQVARPTLRKPLVVKANQHDLYGGWDSDDLPSVDDDDDYSIGLPSFYTPKPNIAIFSPIADPTMNSIFDYSYGLNIQNPDFSKYYKNFPGTFSIVQTRNYEYDLYYNRKLALYEKMTWESCRGVDKLIEFDGGIKEFYKSMEPQEFLIPEKSLFAVLVQHRLPVLSQDPTIKGYDIVYVRLNIGGKWSLKRNGTDPMSFDHDLELNPKYLHRFLETQVNQLLKPTTFTFCGLYSTGYAQNITILNINQGNKMN